MISTRGPNNVLVLDRSTVPVVEICSAIISMDDITDISKKYPVSTAEIFACAELYSDHYGPTEYDFIELESQLVDKELEVITVGISDWVFLSLINFAHFDNETTTDIRLLYSMGLQKVLTECLIDIKNGEDHYEYSDLHRYVLDAFMYVYGPVDQDNVEQVLNLLEIDESNNDYP